MSACTFRLYGCKTVSNFSENTSASIFKINFRTTHKSIQIFSVVKSNRIQQLFSAVIEVAVQRSCFNFTYS